MNRQKQKLKHKTNNMKKLVFLLFPVMLLLGLASCTDDDNVQNAEGPNVITPSNETEPTDDQMSVMVTADLSAYVPSAFDEGSTGAALVARLPMVTGDIQPDTRLVLLKGSDFDFESALPADEIREIARSYMNGAYIALEHPTRQQAANLLLSLLVFITELSEADLQQNFSVDAAAAAAAVSQSRAVERLKVRMENIERIGNAQNNVTTRSGETDTEELLGEMLILGTTDYFLQQPLGANSAITFHSEDGEGNVTDEQPATVTVNRTPYVSGKLADAAAQWLNDELKPQGQKPLAAPRRTDGSTAINDVMGASESFTYYAHVPIRIYDGSLQYYCDCLKMIVRSWGVHNMQTNKDYYYLTQDVKISLDEDTWFPYGNKEERKNTWWPATNYGDYNCWVGSCLSGYVTSMNLTGDGGTVQLEAALPSTDNNSTTLSVETGSSSSTTHTEGYTVGFSYGLSSGSGLGTALNLSGSESWGYTEGTSFALESTYYSNEWRVTKRTDRTDGNNVSWTYKGAMPQFRVRETSDHYYYEYDDPADILTNDCDMKNEICWSVANPVGQYTVDISSMTETGAILFLHKSKHKSNPPHAYVFTSEDTNYSHTLLQPSRATQTWRMDVNIEEWENESVPGARSQLVAYIKEGFPDLYCSVFKVADKSIESLDMINYLVTYSKEKFNKNYETMRNYARELGIRKYSISWRCDERNVHTINPYVVDVTAVPSGLHAQALWCKGNSTLYFIDASDVYKENETWDGQTITRVWADDEVLNTKSNYRPSWLSYLQGWVTRVVFDKSFADARPTCCANWFLMLASIETFEGLENLNTSKVTSTAWMFHGCESLETLDVSGFDMSNVTDANHMFSNCIRLRTIYSDQSWNIRSSEDMFRLCSKLKGAVAYNYEKVDCSMANPETGYFTWPEGGNWMTLNEKGSNSTLLKRYEGQTVVVRYSRTLTAKIDDDGNYVATPFTVCLPYDLDLAQAVNAGQAEIYTLAAVASGQFVFAKLDITTLEAGVPYLVRVLKGSIALGGHQLVIKATKPKSTKVYSSLAQWRRGEGTEIGLWVGNFDYLNAADAADDNAFALQTSDYRWDYYKAGVNAWIPAFRCYLSSSSIEKKAYQSRFTE